MNTKEAIRTIDRIDDWLTNWQDDADSSSLSMDTIYILDNICSIKDLLQQGEKYKKIVEEIDERLMPGKVNIVDCPNGTNMGDLSTMDLVRLTIKDIKKKYCPEPKGCEEVLILTVKGKKKEVDNVIFNIEHVFRNSAHVNVKRGTRAGNVQES